MYLRESNIEIKIDVSNGDILTQISTELDNKLTPDSTPVRFVVNDSFGDIYQCEVAYLEDSLDYDGLSMQSILQFRKRTSENSERFNAVLIVPTGVGAEIGGHAGDATPVATLMSSICDLLITHPNVLNGSD